jgi:ribosomal protein S12 methylthiotransferase accessory factor
VEAYANPLCGTLGTMAIPAFGSPTSAPVTGFTRVRGQVALHEFFWSGHANSYDRSTQLGLLEGLERYAGLAARGLAPRVVRSLNDLGQPALDPRDYGVYVDEFYEAGAPYFTRFTPDLPIPWVWGYSLRDQRALLVPERLVYYLGRGTGPNFVEECSNGCAIGSCAEEAVLHGMLAHRARRIPAVLVRRAEVAGNRPGHLREPGHQVHGRPAADDRLRSPALR